MAQELCLGDRAPAIVGATAGGRFYSLDSQAGRPAMLVTLGAGDPEGAGRLFERLMTVQPALAQSGVDLVPLAAPDAALAALLAGNPSARDLIVYLGDARDIEALEIDHGPTALLLDRGGRIVAVCAVGPHTDMLAFYRRAAAQLASDAGRLATSSAPVLVVPNILSLECCAALIDHFERSNHVEGVMASVKDGVAVAKLDESKKRRRDMELTADSPLHRQIVEVMAMRCAPEIKRAFQSDITFADRVLIARYDDTGGYFTRHRDNVAAHTAFREFALSINLNTQDYDGGALQFPEYDDNRYSPPAGSAIMFSASLLHEVTPVTRGSRYVLLSFLCSAAAQALYPAAA